MSTPRTRTNRLCGSSRAAPADHADRRDECRTKKRCPAGSGVRTGVDDERIAHTEQFPIALSCTPTTRSWGTFFLSPLHRSEAWRTRDVVKRPGGGATSCVSADGGWSLGQRRPSDQRENERHTYRKVTHRKVLDTLIGLFEYFVLSLAEVAGFGSSFSSSFSRRMRRRASSRCSLCSNSFTSRS